MTRDDFQNWRHSLGWHKSEAARQLGLSRNAIDRYEAGSTRVPRYLALACAALSARLQPWGTRENDGGHLTAASIENRRQHAAATR